VAKRSDRALGLVAASMVIALAACGGQSAAPAPGATARTPAPSTTASGTASAPGTAPAVITTPAPGSAGSTTEREVAWFVDGGRAELHRLSAAVTALGKAPNTIAALGTACARFAAAVASAQAGPPVPDQAAQASLSGALAEYAKSAATCQAGASAHSRAMIGRAAPEISAGTADVLRFEQQTRDAQSVRAQRGATARCQRLFLAWKRGPASAGNSQLLSALKALQVAGSGTNLPAIAAAAANAGQAATQLEQFPVPACADPSGYFAAILARVQTAAAAAAGAGTARRLPEMVHALAPLTAVPALEAAFTDEVKLTALA
jgi:hypothetical protein